MHAIRKYALVFIALMTMVLFVVNYLHPFKNHILLVSPLLVLLTILTKDKKGTYLIAAMITALVVVDYLLEEGTHGALTYLKDVIIPALFVWGFAFSIIKYKESQSKLIQTTELQHAMFEHANEGIIISNTKGHIILANPTACKQMGYANGELTDMRIEQLIPQRFASRHPMHRQAYNENPTSRNMGKNMTLSALRKDGSEFPVEISLSSFKINEELFIISFIIDITPRIEHERLLNSTNQELESRVSQRTMELASLNLEMATVNSNLKAEMRERAKIEEALRDSQRLYSTIAHNFPDGIICVLNDKLKIVFIDGRELDLLNLNRDSMTGQSWTSIDLCASSKYNEVEQLLSKVFSWEIAQMECEFKERIYAMNAVPLPDVNGAVKEILLVIRNITRWRNAEQELYKSLEKEKALNEMKSRFVSIASHEFRTPLSTILTSVSLADKYHLPEDREKRQKHIERIKNSVKNLTEILNDFLSLEKLEAGKVDVKPENFNIEEFCSELASEIQSLSESGQQIIYKHTDGEYTITTDKQLLRNILINLLSNAMKYSLPNGIIEFTSKVEDGIILEVKDHGIGIPEEDQQHLFERFFRANNATTIQGTGLGLNIVRRYVNLLDGHIAFTSKLNQGTTFTIGFPKTIKPV